MKSVRHPNSQACWDHQALRGKARFMVIYANKIKHASTTGEAARDLAAQILILSHQLSDELDNVMVLPEPRVAS